jgi:large subunit ribosomal protein L24
VQTTLLTFGIAIILALVAALVGPAVVDWQEHKAEIEEQAKEIVGVQVQVGGTIDVRLLPTPSLTLGDVRIGPPDSARKVFARGLSMELSLGNLMRGEFRANQVTLDHPEVRIGLDKSGALQMPGLALNFDADRLAIERLTITDGKLLLYDGASGARLAVEGLNVSGEVGSLIGPFKAEGAFAAGGEHYSYHVAGGRRGDDGGMKIRLSIEADERALSFESDGTVWIDGGAPRFEGAAALSPWAGKKDSSGRVTLINDPWKVSGRVKASPASVQLDKMEMSYGPEGRVIRVNGDAAMTFGQEPRISGTLMARQIDFDRILPSGEQKRSPFETVKLLVDELAEAPAPPLPVHITVGIDSLMAGGATVSALHGDVETAADGWTLDRLEMRAPGATQVRIAGKLALADNRKVEFQGPVNIDSNDPAVFFAWIEGRSAAGRPPLGPMRGAGAVTVGRERVAVETLKAEIERKTLEGRVAYRFATSAAPARLDAALNGAELDLDRTVAIGKALFASTSFERPGEIALALDIGRASYMGVDARKAQAKLTYDRSGLKIEQLSIAEIAGASFDASGRLDNAAETWRGSVTLGLAAPRLDGVTALADKFLPQALLPEVSDALRKYGPRVAPLKVSAKLDLEPQPGAANGRTVAKLKLDGTTAGINVSVEANAAGEISDPAAATVLVGGRLDAPDGRALAGLIGLDALANADSRQARMTFAVDGAANKTFYVNGKLTGADLNATADGWLTASGDGTLDVTFHAANTKLPRRAGGPAAIPADLKAHLSIKGTDILATDIGGKVAGASVKGAVTVGVGEPLRLNGRIETDQADASELFAILTGAPRPAGAAPEWIAEPFGQPAAPPMAGRVEFRANSVQWTAGAPARDVAGTIKFDPSGFSVTDVSGRVADGRFALDGNLRHDRAGVFLRSHVKVTNADMPALLGGVLRVPTTGRLTLEAELQGQGLSPASLVGSLNGSGTLTAENVELAGLNPNAADTVLNALESDRSLANNSARVAQIASTALDAGKLKIASVTTPVVIADGRAQLSRLQASAQNTDISGLISLALADWQVNARFTMTAPPRKNAPNAERPVMAVQARGPLAAAQRTVDAGSLIAWATQRSIDQETRRLEEIEKERRRMELLIEQRKQSEAAKQYDNKQPDAAHPSDAAPGAGSAPAQTGTSPSSIQGSPAGQGGAAPGSSAGFERRLRPGSGPVVSPGP